jgi:tRNA(Ile)-lysidine synthase
LYAVPAMNNDQNTLESRFSAFVRSAGLVKPGDRVLLAVSGGVDSMVMLHLFEVFRRSWNLELHIAHLNHQLRGDESLRDEEFVRQTAEALGLPCHTKRADILDHAHRRRLSKQEAAREVRYQFLEDVRSSIRAASVATAHQADDNAETVLLNALRGTGIRGLAGIPTRRDAGKIIRPLLFARRAEIEGYADAHTIPYRTDSSNESTEYTRNYLRKAIIPLLSEVYPDVTESLNRISRMMRQLDERIGNELDARWPSLCGLDEKGRTVLIVPRLLSEPAYLQEEIAVRLLRSLDIETHASAVRRILDLCTQPSGRSLQLSGALAVYRDRDRLVVVPSTPSQPFFQKVDLGSRYTFPTFEFSVSSPLAPPPRLDTARTTEFADADRLGGRLVLRSWKDGDWFIPLGMQTKKKLSDYFTDEKVPLFEKPTIPILESEGAIVWVCGKRLDDRFKVTDRTRSVVKLEYFPTTPHH